MKIKYFSIAAVILSLLLVVVGCSSGTSSSAGGSEQESGSASSSNETVTIKFSYWGDKNEVALKQRMIKAFEDSHPNIKIDGTYTDGGTYPTKLQTFFSSNTAPDVISIAGDIMSDFVDKDVFEDLTPYMEKDGLASGAWSDNFINVFRHNDKIIAAPFVYKIPAVVYNKDLFDQAQIPYPTDDWTENQMLEMAQKLTDQSNGTWGFNLSWFPSTIVRNLYGTPLYNTEDNTVNAENNDQFKHAFTFLTEMVTKHKVSPDDAAAKSAGGGFETGKFAMSLTAPWEMQSFQTLIGDKFKWDLVKLPVSEEYGPWKAILFADGIGMSPKSKNKDEAWEFIKYMTSDEESQKIVADLGIPSLLKVIQSDEYVSTFPDDWTPYNKKVFVDMLDSAIPWYTTGVYAKLNDELTKQYQTVIQGKTTVDEAAAYLQKKGTELLSSGK